MACSKSSKRMGDFFGNAPDIVIDKILENLPIRMAAQTSVLSKRWRCAWLSLKSLIFDLDFWKDLESKEEYYDLQKFSQIISNILLHHRGSVHDFYLYIPAIQYANRDHTNPSQWISFLSNNGVKKITIINNWHTKMGITSYIYWCKELVGLELKGFRLCPPPTDFCGFPNLKHLVLEDVHFTQNIFSSLIKDCRIFETLKLVECSGMDQVVIDAPSLQTLVVLNGNFGSLVFKNFRSLKSISLCLNTIPKNHTTTVATIDTLNLLASFCQLQSITFDGHLFKYFATGGVDRSLLVTFNHLDELCLTDLSLSEFGVLRDLLSMIERCPYIKKLIISVNSGNNVGQDIDDFNYNYKLDNLHEVSIKGITGSSAELKLVEYLLAISPILENMFFYSDKLVIESEQKMLRALMGFPRASPKARLLFLEK